MIGNLSNTERVLVGFDVRTLDEEPFTVQKGKKHAD
jgi:hypothetical protein